MELTGVIESIIYKNESNGYTIALLDTEGTETTIVGYLPFISKGDNIKVQGKMVVHPDYGEQMKIDTFEKIMPQTLDALEKYLGSGSIKGIGPATAKKIVKKFKNDTINIMRSEPEKLSEIKGITVSKAREISESFIESIELWQIVEFLEKFGIGTQSAQTIYKKLGDDTINKIKNDPYILEEIGIRVDFAQIDKMALEIGIERSSLRRVGMGIIHALNLATYNGHSCVLKNNLIDYTTVLLGVSNEDVEGGIKDLQAKERIMLEKRSDVATVDGKTELVEQTWVYLENFYRAEMNIAERISGLQNSTNVKKISNIDKIIKKVIDIEPSEKQREALDIINDNNVSIITGGPGTGKTTIIKTVISIYKSLGRKTVLCAPTGRAAKRMTEATGEEAKTLHRLLEIGKAVEENPNPNMSVAPIDADIIIIDEMSMVDIFLMNYVLNGIYKGTKLVLVGDIDQLASVGPGTVLKDLIESKTIPYIALNKIFRQAAKSKIIVNAHKVNEGIDFIGEKNDDETLDDFEFISNTNTKEVQEIILDKYKRDVQIITPTKKGELGTKTLNKLIQERINPEDPMKQEKKFGDTIFREGDKVMQTKNNYDIEWNKESPDDSNVFAELQVNFSDNKNVVAIEDNTKIEFGSGVFNGEMGIIEEINNYEGTLDIKFEDGKNATYMYSDLDQIEHSYAITVHKSQGSEFDTVIMPILNAAPMLLTRNLLYTGMTRAKKKLSMIGSQSIVEYMINNVNSKKRNSGLKYKLQEINK